MQTFVKIKYSQKDNYIPEGEEGLLSESGEASSYAKYKGEDAKSRVNRYERGAETGRALIADQQEKEAEETDCVLEAQGKYLLV